MKKNILLYVFLGIIAILLIAFGFTAYKYYIAIHADDPIHPYVAAHGEKITVTRGDIAVDMTNLEEYDLEEGDTIITLATSEATVFWPDGSTTQLWNDTKMVIDVMRVADDYSKIQLQARLERGKVWSNIVRTLYPESYVRFKLPDQRLVAGVRWSIFEINLDKNYIHSVQHALVLKSEVLGQSVVLLQGEIASVWDIFKRLSQDVLDEAWVRTNKANDALYDAGRKIQNELTLQMMRGSNALSAWWNNFVKSMVEYLPGFEDLQYWEAIANNKVDEIRDLSQEKIIEFAQKLKNTDFTAEKDLLRNTLAEATKGLPDASQWLQSLQQDALWEALSLPDGSFDGVQDLLKKSNIDPDTTIKSIQESLQNQDFSADALNSIRSIFQ